MAASATANLTVRIRGQDAGAGATLSGVNRQLGTVSDGADGAERNLKQISGALAGIGIAAAAMGAALLAAFKSVMETTSDFEAAMNRVRALITEAGQAPGFEKLQQRARELGATTEYTATQVADGMRFLTMAGQDAGQVFANIKPAIDLASAGYLELAEAADIVTNIMTPFKLGAERTTEAVNVLAVVAAKSNTDIRQLGEAMAYAAPLAADVGMTVQETAAAFGAMAQSGIRATIAGTSVRGMIASLSKITPKAQKALDKLGVSVAKNEDGSVRLVETLRRLKEANWSVADATQIFTLRAATGARVLSQNLKHYEMLIEKMREGKITAESMAEIGKREGLTGALIKLSSAWQGLKEAVGNSLLTMKDAILYFADLLSKITKWARENPKLAGTIVAVVGALGGLLVVIGGLMTAIGGLGLLLPSISIGLAALGAAIGPILAVGAAIAGVVAGIYALYKARKELWGVDTAFKAIWKTITFIPSVIWKVIDAIGDLYYRITTGEWRIKIVTEEDVKAAQALVKDYRDTAKEVEKLNALGKKRTTEETARLKALGNELRIYQDKISKYGYSTAEQLNQALERMSKGVAREAKEAVKETKKVLDETKKPVEKIKDYVAETKKELAGLDAVIKKIMKTTQKMRDEISQSGGGVDTKQANIDFAKYVEIVKSGMSDVVKETEARAKKMQAALREAIEKGAAPEVIAKLKANITKAIESGSAAVEALTDKIESSIQRREDLIRDSNRRIEEMKRSHEQQLLEIHDSAESAIRQAARKSLTEEQKQADSRAYIRSRAYMATELIAKGDEDSLKRAQKYTKDMLSAAQELKDPGQQMIAIQAAEQLMRKATIALQEMQVQKQKESIKAMEEQITNLQKMKAEIGKVVDRWKEVAKKQTLNIDTEQAKSAMQSIRDVVQIVHEKIQAARSFTLDTSTAEARLAALQARANQIAEIVRDVAKNAGENVQEQLKNLSSAAGAAANGQQAAAVTPGGPIIQPEDINSFTGAIGQFGEMVGAFGDATKKGVAVEVTAKGAIDTKVSNDTQYDNWR